MKRIIIDEQDDITRVALVNNSELIEIYYESKNDESFVGNIYIGRVTKVVPNLQGCFVDIGLKKNGYLYYGKSRTIVDDSKESNKPKVGDNILVQVEKDMVGSKGASLTKNISIAGKFMVLVLGDKGEIGVSKKISESSERNRIKNIITEIVPSEYIKNNGILVRTNGKGKNEKEFADELNELLVLVKNINFSEYIKAPSLILEMSVPIDRVIRDFYNNDIDEFVVNSKKTYDNLVKRNEFQEHSVNLVYYEEKEPVFSHYYIESQEKKALDKKVWLKSGGFLIIEETEACVVIDVNSGKSAGKGNMENTVKKINTEAGLEVAKQLRLRNLSGIIIVDFIDMAKNEDKEELTLLLQKAVKKDRIKTHIVGMTELGLMQITRKKTRQSLSRQMETKCLQCMGHGKLPSPDWLVLHIRCEIENIFANTIYNSITVEGNEQLVNLVLGYKMSFKESMKTKYNCNIDTLIDNNLKYSKYNIINGKKEL